MNYIILLLALVFTGCADKSVDALEHSNLSKTMVASYGQTNSPYAEARPMLFDNKIIYFDGQHVRTSPLGSLINYDVISDFSLRNKPEYFNETQAYAVTDENQLVLVDIQESTMSYVMDLKGPVLYSPTLINQDKIFIQYLDNTIECVDNKTLTTVWAKSLPDVTANYYAGYFKPLFDNQKVYFSVPGGLFVALDIETGETIWTYTSQIAKSNSTHNIADFLSPKSLMFQGNENIILMNSDGYVHCLSKSAGLSRWVRSGSSSSNIVERDSKLFTVNSSNQFIAFDESYDSPIWSLDLEDKALEDFAIINDKVWLVFEGKIWELDLNGEFVNKYQHDTDMPHLISNVAKDKLLLGDKDKYVYNLVS